MLLFLDDGKQLRGDLIKSAVLRSDLAPVPLTLEAEIRADDALAKRLVEGKVLKLANGDALQIVMSERAPSRDAQGRREMSAIRLTALLRDCHQVAFIRDRAIIKEGATLSAIYRATGATLRAITGDFPVARFTCLAGGTPAFFISRALQEEGGVVRWSRSRMQFFRLSDLFKQKVSMTLPENAGGDIESGFLARHDVPSYFTLDQSGSFLRGSSTKARKSLFLPFSDASRLRNMSRCLVLFKTPKINFASQVSAGDLIAVQGAAPLVVMTAAHVFESGTDGTGANQYTKLWLGRLEE